jgi:hypothetical protein
MADNTGFITVFVTTATGSSPVPDAEVMISKITSSGDTVLYRYVTDGSGQTPLSELESPLLQNSLSEGSEGPDFSLYNVTVNSDGFYPLVSLNVPVFTGVISRQQMMLVPFTASSDGGMTDYAPECLPYPGGCGPVADKGGKE